MCTNSHPHVHLVLHTCWHRVSSNVCFLLFIVLLLSITVVLDLQSLGKVVLDFALLLLKKCCLLCCQLILILLILTDLVLIDLVLFILILLCFLNDWILTLDCLLDLSLDILGRHHDGHCEPVLCHFLLVARFTLEGHPPLLCW